MNKRTDVSLVLTRSGDLFCPLWVIFIHNLGFLSNVKHFNQLSSHYFHVIQYQQQFSWGSLLSFLGIPAIACSFSKLTLNMNLLPYHQSAGLGTSDWFSYNKNSNNNH